jgi:hypothetical protein
MNKQEMMNKIAKLEEEVTWQYKELVEARMMRDLRVPRRDHDALLKSMSICQSMIERLMISLFKASPKHPDVADARTILALLEDMIHWNSDMQNDAWNEREMLRLEEINKRHREHLAETLMGRDQMERFYESTDSRGKISGHVIKEYKP